AAIDGKPARAPVEGGKLVGAEAEHGDAEGLEHLDRLLQVEHRLRARAHHGHREAGEGHEVGRDVAGLRGAAVDTPDPPGREHLDPDARGREQGGRHGGRPRLPAGEHRGQVAEAQLRRAPLARDRRGDGEEARQGSLVGESNRSRRGRSACSRVAWSRQRAPHSSIAKPAETAPCWRARSSPTPAISPARNPPAKASPAPVGSTTATALGDHSRNRSPLEWSRSPPHAPRLNATRSSRPEASLLSAARGSRDAPSRRSSSSAVKKTSTFFSVSSQGARLSSRTLSWGSSERVLPRRVPRRSTQARCLAS